MKISHHWLQQYIPLHESPEEVARLLTFSGLEVESIEAHEAIKGGLAGVVVGEVLTCAPHPNADKLTLTSVDVGDEQPLPIVCGAPNVAAGQKVLVATVGTTLYPTSGESFTIKKAKIRGEDSEGMICAEDELGLGTSHAGIMVLNTQLPNGTPAAVYLNLQTDSVYEIGLTPNRADAASHIGVARDLRALLHRPLTWPTVDSFSADSGIPPIQVEVENSQACPRYAGITLDHVQVGPSPEWMQQRLKSIGITPINNVVDATNFVMHELGQPLHAFDADKIAGNKVVVKTMPEGTPFTTLDEKERKLTAQDVMICDAEKPMCLAGVFGGIHSGVKESTTRVFLESAYFSPEWIRKSAQHHQLKTDASFRYERGTDPNMPLFALKRAVLLIQEIAGGTCAGPVIDVYPTPVEPFRVKVKYAHVHRLIGKKLTESEVETILQHLDIEVKDKTQEGFVAVVPPYRVDVQREADVIEEILRIYGLNNVEIGTHAGSAYLADFPAKDNDKLKMKAAKALVANGFFEIITNSLTKASYAQIDSSLDAEQSVSILNPLSEDLHVLRQTLLYSGLEVVAYNINRKQTDLKLFEFGTVYRKTPEGYAESQQLALFITGNKEEENWITKTASVTFHDLYAVVGGLLNKILRQPISPTVVQHGQFDYCLELSVRKKVVAQLGKVSQVLAKKVEVKQEIFYANLDWDLIFSLINDSIVVEEISRFPEVRRDLSLVVDKQVLFEDIRKAAMQVNNRLIADIRVFDVYEGENLGENKKAYALSFKLQDKQQTLTDKVIDKTMQSLMAVFEKDLGALIRK
jgi:phenylalanyl-tRNA synthetase beta chain